MTNPGLLGSGIPYGKSCCGFLLGPTPTAERITIGTGMGTRRTPGVGLGLAVSLAPGPGVGVGLEAIASIMAGVGVGAFEPPEAVSVLSDFDPLCFRVAAFFFFVGRDDAVVFLGCAIASPIFLKNSMIGLGLAQSAPTGINDTKRIRIDLFRENLVGVFTSRAGLSHSAICCFLH